MWDKVRISDKERMYLTVIVAPFPLQCSLHNSESCYASESPDSFVSILEPAHEIRGFMRDTTRAPIVDTDGDGITVKLHAALLSGNGCLSVEARYHIHVYGAFSVTLSSCDSVSVFVDFTQDWVHENILHDSGPRTTFWRVVHIVCVNETPSEKKNHRNNSLLVSKKGLKGHNRILDCVL